MLKLHEFCIKDAYIAHCKNIFLICDCVYLESQTYLKMRITHYILLFTISQIPHGQSYDHFVENQHLKKMMWRLMHHQLPSSRDQLPHLLKYSFFPNHCQSAVPLFSRGRFYWNGIIQKLNQLKLVLSSQQSIYLAKHAPEWRPFQYVKFVSFTQRYRNRHYWETRQKKQLSQSFWKLPF